MKSFLKFLMTAIGLVLILLGVASILLFTRANRFVSDAVEARLREAFDAPVSLDTIQLAPLERTIEVRNIVVANPEGFKDTPALEIEALSIEIVPASLFGDHTVVRTIRLSGADVYYRYELGRGLNIPRLLDQPAEESGVGGPPRYVVDEFWCDEAELHFSTNLVPASRVGLNMVTVHLTDLQNREALSSRRIANIFVRSLLRETLTLNGLLDPAVQALEGGIDRLAGNGEEEE